MNRAGAKQRILREAELLGTLLSEHPDNAAVTETLATVLETLKASTKHISEAFPGNITNAHTWFDTNRKKVVTLKNGKASSHPSHTGGHITCHLVTEPEVEFKGTSVCMESDTFDGDFGRRLALFRARSAAYKAEKKKEYVAKAKSHNKPNVTKRSRIANMFNSFISNFSQSVATSYYSQHHP